MMNCDYVALKEVELPPITSPQSAPPAIQNWGNCIQGYHFRYVRGTEIARWRRVNKHWQKGINSKDFAYVWKEAIQSDFGLPESSQQKKSYQVLYKEKACAHLNIKYQQPKYTPISRSISSSAILVNDHFVDASFGKITLHRISPCGSERTITSFPSSASPNIIDKQKNGIMDRRVDKHFIETHLVLSRASQDLFFSRSKKGTTVCLWEISTGNCLFANDNISTNINNDLQLVDDLVIYTTNRQHWTGSNDIIYEVQVWDYKSQQLIGAFNLPDVGFYYRHHLKDKILVSDCARKIVGHHLETQEKLYEFSHCSLMKVIITDKRLLIYRHEAQEIKILDIKDGSLFLELPSGYFAIPNNRKNFLCYKNYCLIQASDFELQVWDLDKGERIQDLKLVFPPGSDQVDLACPFIIHHDRLIAHYAYNYNGSRYGHLVVWNLKDFSELISAECEVGSLNFMDDHLLVLDVSNPKKEQVRFFFWNILEGKVLGFSKKNVWPTDYGEPYQIDFLNGKMFIKNQWEHSARGIVDGAIYDFSVHFKPKAKTTEQKILKAVQSVFCF